MPSPADRIVSIYQRYAAAFDHERNKTLFERAWLDRFSEQMVPGAPVLDLGCGSGEPLARELIARSCALTGIDTSQAMIDMCRHRFPDHVWAVADMRRLALQKRFAGILAWDSFFHLTPDAQRAMFPIFAAHAAAGAMLMFTSGPRESEAIGSFKGEPLYHASLSPRDYAALLSGASFEIVHHRVEDPDCGGRTVWLARYLGSDAR